MKCFGSIFPFEEQIQAVENTEQQSESHLSTDGSTDYSRVDVDPLHSADVASSLPNSEEICT